MPSPRHRQRAVRQRRRTHRRLALAGLVMAAGASVLLAALQRDPDGAELSAERRSPDASVTTVMVATTTTTAPTTTTAAPVTTTSTTPPTTVTPGWYAVVESAPKGAGSRDALRSEVAQHGERGLVIDTDDFRTGDGQAPDYLPAPGILAAVVGPFGSLDEVQTWCAGYDGDRGCHARQLLPR